MQENKVNEPLINEIPPEQEMNDVNEISEPVLVEALIRSGTGSKLFFEKSLWKSLEVFAKKYHKDQRARIKTIFDKIVKIDDEMFEETKDKLFVDALKKDIQNKRIKENGKLTLIIIEEVEHRLNQLRSSVST